MPTYIKNRAEAYGCLEELNVDLRTARACTPGWDITVIARMFQKGITMEMKAEVILGCKTLIKVCSKLLLCITVKLVH